MIKNDLGRITGLAVLLVGAGPKLAFQIDQGTLTTVLLQNADQALTEGGHLVPFDTFLPLAVLLPNLSDGKVFPCKNARTAPSRPGV